jgi:acyl-CoA synthetase (AMP-forming)/AMP-acid ligase II
MSGAPRLPDAVRSVPEALAFWAETTPGLPAVIGHEGTVVTSAALWQNAQALAAALHCRGVGRGDRVVLLLPEGPRLALALLGTACAAIAVPLHASLTTTELGSALTGLNAAAVIVASPLPGVREVLARHGTAVLELRASDGLLALEGAYVGDPGGAAHLRPDAGDIAIVSQSSGTTGKPKRVPYFHGGLMISGREHRDAYGLGPGDRGVAVSPMSVSLGTSTLLQGIVAGSALIFPEALDPDCVWGAMRAERPTWMQASSGFLELLTRYLRGRPASESVPLRFVRATSAAISSEIREELAQRLGGPVLPSYSSSEAGRISMALPPPAVNPPGSVGKPVQELAIVDEQGVAVRSGVVGEIWLHAPRVFAGYLDDPDATAAALAPGGWFRTGDTGYLDEDGFMFLTGRRNELINRGGAKIAPVEVDSVLLAHPTVSDAACFAVPDERFGEDIVAAVVLEPGRAASPRELRTWMLGHLAPHKVPRRIWFVDVLPRTLSTKVQRGELARRWRAGHG